MPPRSRNTQRLIRALGVVIPYALVLYVLVWLGIKADNLDLPFLAGLVMTPATIGALTVILADPDGTAGSGRHILWTTLAIFGLVILSVLIFQEVGICIVMALPLLLLFGIVSALVTGGLLRESSSRKGPALLVVVPLLGMPVDAAITYPTERAAVTTVIEIDAPPAMVWQHTVAIPDIRAEELRFTISHNLIGVPKPVDARLEGEGPGAVRQLRWGQGIHFQEHVTEWEQDRRLAWRFHFAPDSIPAAVEAHIRVDSNYLRLEDGDYVLEPLPGNRTRLTLTTRYSMATPFNDYCRWWGERFLGDFHGIVLDIIRARAEAAAAGA